MNAQVTTRRRFATRLLATGAVAPSALGGSTPASQAAPGPSTGAFIDTQVWLGAWPTRALPDAGPQRLSARLRRHGITQAWTGSFDALLHKDLSAVNARLAADCREAGRGFLLPFGTVNPAEPGWRAELDRCATLHRMPGVRVFPAYHGYRLDDRCFTELLEATAQSGLLVQIGLSLEDERMRHPMLRADAVDTGPLAEVIGRCKGARVQLLNALRTLRAKPLLEIIATGRVSVEISTLEGVGGLEALLAQVPARHVAFGSHAPLLYFESALLKLHESVLPDASLDQIRWGTARSLLASPA